MRLTPLALLCFAVTSLSFAQDEMAESEAVSAVPKRFHYLVRAGLRTIYDDNIFLRSTGSMLPRENDFYFGLEPAVTLGIGDITARQLNFLRLDYAPSFFVFAENSEANSLQHVIRLQAQYGFRRLVLTLSQDIQLLENGNLGRNLDGGVEMPNVNLDTSGATDRFSYTTNLAFSYVLTGKTFLSGGVQYSINDYEGLIGSETLSGNLFINYNYSPKLVVGLGGSLGYNRVDRPSPDQTYQQINARATYELTGKISVNVSGGIEFRQYEESGQGGLTSPVYEIGLTYQPFDGTTISLRADRRTRNSAALANQNYSSTNITLGARQRFFQKIYLGISAGYDNSEYIATREGVNATRNDDYYFFLPSIDWTLTEWWTVGAYYLHRRSDSSFAAFDFRNNQFGLRTSLSF